ncbi:MAG: S1 RNA-binding domain-containing protein, partial [Candidatus Hydrogenedentota bacterium]
VIEGVVSGVTKFGVFIQFDDRFEGLAHISTLRKEESGNPKNHYKKGQTVKAVVKYIEPETRKISLSIKDVDYALEKMEMERYIVRDSEPELTTSPFQALRELVQK